MSDNCCCCCCPKCTNFGGPIAWWPYVVPLQLLMMMSSFVCALFFFQNKIIISIFNGSKRSGNAQLGRTTLCPALRRYFFFDIFFSLRRTHRTRLRENYLRNAHDFFSFTFSTQTNTKFTNSCVCEKRASARARILSGMKQTIFRRDIFYYYILLKKKNGLT